MTERPEYVVVCVDGPNADNQAAAFGAASEFSAQSNTARLAAVIISGTCVDYHPNASLGSRDDAVSTEVQVMHTARMAGLFKRAGIDVPVFIGKPVADTEITTPIPHSAHVRHEDYDLFHDGDAKGLGRQAIAGNFADALTHIAGLDNTVHIAVGGPFTEIPHFMDDPHIAPKLGHLAAQAGFTIAEKTIYSKLSFNVDVDMLAALKTLLWYPGEMHNVPSDITRASEATFRSAEELTRLGIHPEIAEIFIRHRALAGERHKKEQLRQQQAGQELKAYPSLSIHDLQAVMLLGQRLGLEHDIFELGSIDVSQAVQNMAYAAQVYRGKGMHRVLDTTPHDLGYLGDNQTERGTIPGRFVVTAQDTTAYKARVPKLLGSS